MRLATVTIRSVVIGLAVLLAGAGPAIAQRNCVKGKPCGNTCIAANLTCRVGTTSTSSSPTAAAHVSVPAGMQYVASTQGRVYYHVGCNGWRSLAAANLRFFRTADEAKAAGLTASTQAGCAGPSVAAAPAPAASVAPAAVPAAGSCTVASVTDGDTLRCVDGRAIRLLLIDAPEMTQGPFGALAKVQLEQLAHVGAVLRVEHDVQKQDRYGRELAYLYAGDVMLNEALLRTGMAVVSAHPPNVMYVDRLREIADSARAGQRGLWASSAFECLPEDHRAGRCR